MKLNSEQNKLLFEQLAKYPPDTLKYKSIRNAICEGNLYLVAGVKKKFHNYKYLSADIFSEGTVGLLKAISTFDKNKNIKFATYAISCIRNEILMYLRREKKHRDTLSLYLAKDYGNGIETDALLIDTIKSDEDVAENSVNALTKQQMLEEIENLPEKEKLVIKTRYDFARQEIVKQEDIKSVLKVSRSYVSKLENSGISMLREKMCPAPKMKKNLKITQQEN